MAKKPETMKTAKKKWEGSPADEAGDKKGGWPENSPADKAHDRAGAKKVLKKSKKGY